jgi:hypothetical protein
MNLDPSVFAIHDVSRFPVVTVRNEALQPGYAAHWIGEMDALLAYDEPFAVFYVNAPGDEAPHDLRQRAQWLIDHKARLARVCKVLVSVEADDAQREVARKRGRGATRAFGIPHRAVRSVSEALDIARVRLAAPQMSDTVAE